MKKIVALTIVFLLVIGIAGMASWAYLTASDLADNEVYAGSLDLAGTVSGTGPAGKYAVTPGGNGLNGFAAFDFLLPGDSGTVTWVLVNHGAIPGTLVIGADLTLDDVTQNEVELAVPGNDVTGDGDLGHCLGVKLQIGSGIDQAAAEAAFTYLLGSTGSYAALDGIEDALDGETAAMAAENGTTVVIKLTWNLPSDVKKAGTDGIFGTGDDIDVNENIIQGDSGQIDLTFTLTQ